MGCGEDQRLTRIQDPCSDYILAWRRRSLGVKHPDGRQLSSDVLGAIHDTAITRRRIPHRHWLLVYRVDYAQSSRPCPTLPPMAGITRCSGSYILRKPKLDWCVRSAYRIDQSRLSRAGRAGAV